MIMHLPGPRLPVQDERRRHIDGVRRLGIDDSVGRPAGAWQRQLKRVSRTRSGVGRMAAWCATRMMRPRSAPPMMRTRVATGRDEMGGERCGRWDVERVKL